VLSANKVPLSYVLLYYNFGGARAGVILRLKMYYFEGKTVPLHAEVALGVRGAIAPTLS
jgi:hypothetical protein